MINFRSNPSSGPGPGLVYSRPSVWSLTVFGMLWSSATATCYFPNGTDRNAGLRTPFYQPCNLGDDFSMCCALNRGSTSDQCRSDGLCFAPRDKNVWRESCTDPTWKSSKCIKLCDSGIGQYVAGSHMDRAANDMTVTDCENGSYCCGNGTIADTCCQEGKGLFVLDGKAVSEPPTKANLSSSGAYSPNETKAIVGGVIGGVAVLALLSGFIAWIWMHHRRNTQSHEIPQPVWINQTRSEEAAVPKNNEIYEVDALRPRAELERRSRTELELRPIAELEPGSSADLEHSTTIYNR